VLYERFLDICRCYEMKKDTVRPQDRADADRLRRKFKLE
jgi:hypothetical protein